MLLNNAISLRQAGASDWRAVEALLLANKLPTDGAQAHLPTYLLATSNGEVVGCACIIDLPDLGGSRRIAALGHSLVSLVAFEGH